MVYIVQNPVLPHALRRSRSWTFRQSDCEGISTDSFGRAVGRTVTPMAVTSAPAPAPWMINGRGEYLRRVSGRLPHVATARTSWYGRTQCYPTLEAPSQKDDQTRTYTPSAHTPLSCAQNPLFKLCLDLARLGIDHTDIPHDLSLLERLLPQPRHLLIPLCEPFQVFLL
jgi:hypothetical protein